MRQRAELAEETGLLLAPAAEQPVTLTLAEVPGDERGPAHLHWILGYRFVGDPSMPLHVERDRVAWHPVEDLPAPAVADLAPLLAGCHRVFDPIRVSGARQVRTTPPMAATRWVGQGSVREWASAHADSTRCSRSAAESFRSFGSRGHQEVTEGERPDVAVER